MKLKNKKILVTGGSRGIGRQICLSLVREGADVALTYKTNEDLALAVAKEMSDIAPETDVEVFRCDVSDRISVHKVRERLDKKWGKLDVLVNNAGVNKPADFDQITDDDWDEIFLTNLKGPFIVSQELFGLLSKGKESSVVNIGSVSGQYGGPRTAHYAASKAGLISLSQVIARFGASKNIRCNTVSAGIVASDMGEEGLKAPSVAKAADSILLKRLGTFQEIANTVVFLASSDSGYITAQTVNVNGGLYF